MKPRAIVYIDGYNWYHGIFKHYPEWKWINIETFFSSLRPDDDVLAVKMFSSWIQHDKTAMERQKRYFDALSTLPRVQIILGMFQPREVTCRGTCQSKYIIQEEKKTDVNLAVEMIGDAVNQACDSMFIVSGDSDVQPAVEWIARNRPKIKLTVYVPLIASEQSLRRTDYYRTKGLNVECKFLPIENIKQHQMTPIVKLSNGMLVARPHMWQRSPVVLSS